MKNKKNNKTVIKVIPYWGIIPTAIIILISFIYTQSNRTSMSATLLYFFVGLCLLDIIVFFISIMFLTARVFTEKDVVNRKTTGNIAILLENKGVIPIAAAEVRFLFPRKDGNKLDSIGRKMSILPFSSTLAKLDVVLERRGVFRVGADRIDFYDFLGLVKVRKSLRAFVNVTVLPRQTDVSYIENEYEGGQESDENILELNTLNDYGDIRDYRPGDSMKRIHWKLSTKTDELQVKKYSSQSRDSVTVIGFLGNYSEIADSEEKYCECVDTVIERALSIAIKTAVNVNEVKLCLNGGYIQKIGKESVDTVTATLVNYGYTYAPAVGNEEWFDSDKITIIYGFESLEDALIIFNKVALFPKDKVVFYIIDMSEFIIESYKETYLNDLNTYKKIISEKGIECFLSKERGDCDA